MDSFIHGLGYLGIGVLFLVFLFMFGLRRFLRKISAGGGERIGTPLRIHLEECDSLYWVNQSKVDEARQEFQKQGLTEIASFKVNEMPGLNLLAFMLGSSGIIAIVYEKAALGVWFDLVQYCDDGTSLTVSTAPKGAELKHRPGHDKVRSSGAAPADLYKLFEEKRSGLIAKNFASNKNEFVRLFEKAYAEELDWRNSIGGVSESELRATAALGGKVLTDEAFATLARNYRLKAASGFLTALGYKYCEKNAISEAQWAELSQDIVFVYDNLPVENLKETCSKMNIQLNDDLLAELSKNGLRTSLRTALARPELSNKLTKIDELDYMLPVDVYKVAK
ncbi:MAG: hypothetical protein K2X81_22130 [Candidatus Obscuribacterales bacterium]|nr:hypothetical protein [Candidatus Obscuribacterales bacterium]